MKENNTISRSQQGCPNCLQNVWRLYYENENGDILPCSSEMDAEALRYLVIDDPHLHGLDECLYCGLALYSPGVH